MEVVKNYCRFTVMGILAVEPVYFDVDTGMRSLVKIPSTGSSAKSSSNLTLYPIWDPFTGLKFQIKNQQSWLSVNARIAFTLKG